MNAGPSSGSGTGSGGAANEYCCAIVRGRTATGAFYSDQFCYPAQDIAQNNGMIVLSDGMTYLATCMKSAVALKTAVLILAMLGSAAYLL